MFNPLENPYIAQKMNYYSRLRKLDAYMRSHPAQPIDLTQAAVIACMERTSFSKFFKRAVGMNFQLFVQHWRISIAISQMREADYSLTDIAGDAGFDSLSTFDRTFKKVTGHTPFQYRKRLLAENCSAADAPGVLQLPEPDPFELPETKIA